MNDADTPRTDRELYRIENDHRIFTRDELTAMADFARTLERELNAARAEVKDMKRREHEMSDFLDGVPDSTEEPALDHMKRFVAERDAARAQVAQLRAALEGVMKRHPHSGACIASFKSPPCKITAESCRCNAWEKAGHAALGFGREGA